MDTKFQTSFIPKKALAESAGRPETQSVSVFLIIAIVIFIVSVASAGGVFIYKKILIGQIADMSARLVQAKNSFEPSFIDKANTLNKRIDGGKQLLSTHTAVSPVFDLLENDILATVKFETFSYEFKDGGQISLALTGQAKDFSSIAIQSDILGQDKFLKNPVFSDLNPDQSGNVVFKLNLSLDPSLVSYKRLSSLPVSSQNSSGVSNQSTQ